MPGIIGNGVTLRGFYNEAYQFTFNLAAGITRADVGKVVTIDVSAANTVKLAVADEVPFGILHTFEDRIQEGIKVGTVGLKDSLSVATTGVVAVGDSIAGSATPGIVKKATAANATKVVEILTGNQAVVMFL